jgi:hypothetical protein
MSVIDPAVDQKIKIMGHGLKITPKLKQELLDEGYYHAPLTWIGDDITGPFSFDAYGHNESPFEVRRVDGQLQVFEHGKFFTNIAFYKRPKFWDHQWAFKKNKAGGATTSVFLDEGVSSVITPCGQEEFPENENATLEVTGGKFPFVSLACYNGLCIWPSWGCTYTKSKTACRFCCIPGNYDEDKILYKQPGWFEALGIAVEAAVNEIGDEIGKFSITVDAGTIPGRDKGAAVYIQTLEAIKARLGSLPKTSYIRAVIEPPLDEKWLFALRDAGYTDIQMDVDVYDEAERRDIMPNAKGYRKISDYIKAFKKAKEIFPGEVATQLIVGIQNEARLLAGFEEFASIGVPTLLTPFLVGGLGRKLKRETGADVPSSDAMKSIYERASAILVKHNCPPAQFRGGVSSLAEFMGKRLKRANVVTHDNDLVPAFA